VRRDDEDDRSGEAGGASWVDRIVIPDDLSELDAEVRALRRERRVQRRRQRLRRLDGSHLAGAPLLLVALLLIAGVAGLLVMFQPRRTTGVTALGAAQATDRRLPDTVVTLVDGTTRRIREFKPAVFALAPIGCRCDDQLLRAGTASHRHNLAFYLVDRSLPPLPRGLTDTSVVRLVEPSGTVAARYNAEKDGKRVAGGPVLVLVGPGGDVVRVLPEASPKTLESELSQLTPEASAATS
jgi:hypothetical protein